MHDEGQQRKMTLDHMIDEKFGEIFFLAKDEYDIKNKTPEEQELWDFLEKFKNKLRMLELQLLLHHYLSVKKGLQSLMFQLQKEKESLTKEM